MIKCLLQAQVSVNLSVMKSLLVKVFFVSVNSPWLKLSTSVTLTTRATPNSPVLLTLSFLFGVLNNRMQATSLLHISRSVRLLNKASLATRLLVTSLLDHTSSSWDVALMRRQSDSDSIDLTRWLIMPMTAGMLRYRLATAGSKLLDTLIDLLSI